MYFTELFAVAVTLFNCQGFEKVKNYETTDNLGWQQYVGDRRTRFGNAVKKCLVRR